MQTVRKLSLNLSGFTCNISLISRVRSITERLVSTVSVKQHFSIQTFTTDKEQKRGKTRPTATLNAVMQMFPRLRAVEDLESLPLSEAEVILGPGFVVVKSHKQSHPCRETKSDMAAVRGEWYG